MVLARGIGLLSLVVLLGVAAWSGVRRDAAGVALTTVDQPRWRPLLRRALDARA